MEVPWSRATGELGSNNSSATLELAKGKKASSSSPSQQQQQQHAAWGADAQKVVQLMMGQLRSAPSSSGELQQEDDGDYDLTTLDLLGCKAVAPSSAAHQRQEFKGRTHHNSNSGEFLELDPDHPLPPGWEKCLDLKVTFNPSPNLPGTLPLRALKLYICLGGLLVMVVRVIGKLVLGWCLGCKTEVNSVSCCSSVVLETGKLLA